MAERADPVRFGLIGYGSIGRRHAEALRGMPEARLTAICDSSPSHSDTITGDESTTDNYDALLARDDVEAVVICTPSHLHAAHAIAAARAGKHVIVEKPLTTDVAAARELVTACDSAGVQCAVISQYRFTDGMQVLESAVRAREFGKPIVAQAAVRWHRDNAYYEGSSWRGRSDTERCPVLFNQGVHMVGVLLALFGPPVEVRSLFASQRLAPPAADTVVAILRFAGDVLATFEASTTAWPNLHQSLTVRSDAATIAFDKDSIVAWHHRHGGSLPVARVWPEHCADQSQPTALFRRQYLDIIGAIRGEQPLVVSPAEAVQTLEVLEQMVAT